MCFAILRMPLRHSCCVHACAPPDCIVKAACVDVIAGRSSPQRPAHPYGFSQPLFQCSPRVSGFPLGRCAQRGFGVPLWHTCMLRVARLCDASFSISLSSWQLQLISIPGRLRSFQGDVYSSCSHPPLHGCACCLHLFCFGPVPVLCVWLHLKCWLPAVCVIVAAACGRCRRLDSVEVATPSATDGCSCCACVRALLVSLLTTSAWFGLSVVPSVLKLYPPLIQTHDSLMQVAVRQISSTLCLL